VSPCRHKRKEFYKKKWEKEKLKEKSSCCGCLVLVLTEAVVVVVWSCRRVVIMSSCRCCFFVVQEGPRCFDWTRRDSFIIREQRTVNREHTEGSLIYYFVWLCGCVSCVSCGVVVGGYCSLARSFIQSFIDKLPSPPRLIYSIIT
jgi:hypothetical protein